MCSRPFDDLVSDALRRNSCFKLTGGGEMAESWSPSNWDDDTAKSIALAARIGTACDTSEGTTTLIALGAPLYHCSLCCLCFALVSDGGGTAFPEMGSTT
eukprot:CAMPEP_0115455720 /NCGR_PEP_ID=MMETSP0271-20121206/44305_1 /TAXON_ID=71861 /ORGANISM="Scrippsiella trochoidea, Strain CCMP3099" /LENGTH=99 /DNA_ID=CAMNT_0002882187 /DNA_START=130 /DNA_END=429 /DNA_ORIENTATION=+